MWFFSVFAFTYRAGGCGRNTRLVFRRYRLQILGRLPVIMREFSLFPLPSKDDSWDSFYISWPCPLKSLRKMHDLIRHWVSSGVKTASVNKQYIFIVWDGLICASASYVGGNRVRILYPKDVLSLQNLISSDFHSNIWAGTWNKYRQLCSK
jgi:hypothetical protein